MFLSIVKLRKFYAAEKIKYLQRGSDVKVVDKLHLQQLKKDIEALKGEKVLIRANKGRKKMIEVEGILENTYSNIFVVKFPIDRECKQYRCVTYTYSDLITNTVEIILCKTNTKVSVM